MDIALTNKFAGEPYLLGNGLGSYRLVREEKGRPKDIIFGTEAEKTQVTSMLVKAMRQRQWAPDGEDWYPVSRALAQMNPTLEKMLDRDLQARWQALEGERTSKLKGGPSSIARPQRDDSERRR